MGKIIGIDLGTTYSRVAVMECDAPVIIPNSLGEMATPSVVAFTSRGELLVGSAALRQAAINPDKTLFSVKRYLGSEWRKSIDGRIWTPQEIIAALLRRLRDDAEAYLGESPVGAVVSVPASFTITQRHAVLDAGRIAGLNIMRLINSPSSVALVQAARMEANQNVLICTLGGGFFDASIINIDEGVTEILASCSDALLGGDDFDDRIVQWVIGELKRTVGVDIKTDPMALLRVREAAVHAKEELSYMESSRLVQPYLTHKAGTPVHLDMAITRDTFQMLTSDLLGRVAEVIRKAISDAAITSGGLKKVLLAGGSAAMPALQDMLHRLTGHSPVTVHMADHVALGAAIMGDILNGGRFCKQLILLDATTHSLAIETAGGVATRVLERNHTLPARADRVFSTSTDLQSSLDLHLLQGENPLANGNKSIGRYIIRGIKPAMAGVPRICVSLDLGPDGIIKVSARDAEANAELPVTVTNNGRMSENEIQQAISELKQYALHNGVYRKPVNNPFTGTGSWN